MNQEQRGELEWLKQEQRRLQEQLARLGARLESLDRLTQEPLPSEVGLVESPSQVLTPLTEIPIESIPADLKTDRATISGPFPPPVQVTTPPALPPSLLGSIDATRTPAPISSPLTEPRLAGTPKPPPPLPPPPLPPQPLPPQGNVGSTPPPDTVNSPLLSGSLEMRLGTYWMVRVGALVLLTGLALLARFAYQHQYLQLGPAGKAVLLYLISFGLVTLGYFLPRRRPELKNFSQVLEAAGMAAVYFTTYAAHRFEAVRIIPSAALAAGLLFSWTASMIWQADRRRSEVLALFGVGLAFYTSLVNSVETFTLASNFILSAAALFFLWRHRWVTLSTLSVAAAYGSYAYWQIHPQVLLLEKGSSISATPTLQGLSFLMGYWVLFTIPVLWNRPQQWATRGQAARYAVLNNSMAFALAAWTVWQLHPLQFHWLPLGFAPVLLGIAMWVRRTPPPVSLTEEEKLRVRNIRNTLHTAYVAQGLIALTWGLCSYFTGATLRLALGLKAVSLWVLGRRWDRKLYQLCSVFLTGIVVVLVVFHSHSARSEAILHGLIIGLFFFNAWYSRLTHRRIDEAAPPLPNTPTDWIQRGSVFFTCAGSISLWAVLVDQTPHPWVCVGLAATAVFLALIVPLLRVPEFLIAGELFLLAAVLHWTDDRSQSHYLNSGWKWQLAPVTALFLMMHGWHKSWFTMGGDGTRRGWVGLHACLGVALLTSILHDQVPVYHRILFWSAVGFGSILYGALTGILPLFISGLFLLAVGSALAIGSPMPHLIFEVVALLPATLIVVSVPWGLRRFNTVSGLATPLEGQLLRWVPPLLLAASYLSYVVRFQPERWWFLWMAMPGLGLMGTIRWKPSPTLLSIGAFLVWIGGAFLLSSTGFHGWSCLGLLGCLGFQVFLRRSATASATTEKAYSAWIVWHLLLLFLQVTYWLRDQGIVYSIGWAIVALLYFIAGLLLRERAWRWSGLALLALALGRVSLRVWTLESPQREISFIVLGVVLLIIGFLYTRFQGKIKRWL